MNIDANGEKESLNEHKGNEDGVLGKRRISFQVSGSKVDAANAVDKHGATSGLLTQQQSQGTGVCWERFLHVRSIRVLLVENDDSTRHVVTALLRNCNYEVVDAATGLQAWKILEDLTNHIDIVLTEVVIPGSSGIALLYKIMSHKTRKNVPVIMMSSHDSMGLVFKCLSKGAVDFLVKPIRKNELKNLWQHVWRRCHSSSGSGSVSGTQTQKSVKSKRSDKSENSASGDGENDGSDGLNAGDGSDDGSGAQSSWTKQAVEVDSSRSMSPMDQVAECQDSTCAQVIRPNAEHSADKRVQFGVPRESHEHNHPGAAGNGNELETTKPKNVVPKSENPVEIPTSLLVSKLKYSSETDCNATNNQVDKGQPIPTGESSSPSIDVRESESTREEANYNAFDDSKELNLELSLKRLRGVQDTGRSVQDDRYVLRRSEQSAFSRYNTSSSIFKAPNGIAGSSSVLDNSNEVTKRESVGDINAYSTDRHVYQSSNGVSNNIDMGSTTNKPVTQKSIMKDKSEGTSIINGLHPSAFKPVINDHRYSQKQVNLLPNDMQTTDEYPVRGSQQELQIHHPQPHNCNHRHHHHAHNSEQQPSSNHDELSLKKLAADALLSGSTNVVGGPVEGNLMNYSLNRSASGSNHGSNGQNGSSTAINAVGTNAESDVGQAGKSGSGDASGSGSGNRLDENKLAIRKAALNKFRLKRKERCFQKKVRYHNRKKLAEQRPRVRGQFVKQTGGPDSSDRTGDE
ncbi:hypothetical protein BUALT_Bualt09G0069300 [Buddleja alternifolia]|uniref:Pseudo-response regulator 7 n=1 Tax=Buddleja alternifolia TaxID=168488 RepID=A0AAV6X2A2_9LAMI|nr:hypothetical protein BUALT_Bualt09G0069300 [Buddleja alternifolia]